MTREGTLLPGRRPGSGRRGRAADAGAIGSLPSVRSLHDVKALGGFGNTVVCEIYAASPDFLRSRNCDTSIGQGLGPPARVRPSWRRGARTRRL